MGSGNSRLGGSAAATPPGRGKVNLRLSSLLCGSSSSSSSSFQREDHAGELIVTTHSNRIQHIGSSSNSDETKLDPNSSTNDCPIPAVEQVRRNSSSSSSSRGMFWDALSAPLLLTPQDPDSVGSRRRWLLDIADSDSFTTDRPRNSTSQFWDRLRGAATEITRRASCPLDFHSDGTCSCELDEEASALSSISRIVLLAEALFEVLDEIHQQPDSFALSVLSVPSPETVVDSLPLRTYEKPGTAGCGEDVDQCYICLVEYEEGDKIRVLPCRHEYHMSCVDKWLKEIHGICPLCRGEVGEEVAGEVAASTSDAVVI